MFRNKSHIVIVLLFVSMFLSAAMTYTPIVTATNTVTRRQVPTPGTGGYFEDFTTTTYLDPGPTNADGWGNGAITNPRTFNVQLLDYYSTPDPVVDVDVQGRKAYTVLYDPASAAQTVRILDIANPYDITLMGDRSSSSYLNSTIVDGDTLYVGSSDGAGSWLGVYNVSNPYNIPFPIDTYNFGAGNITDFDVQGHFLYIAVSKATTDDFTIIDVEDPGNINVIRGLSYTDLYGVDVEGQLAYLADGIYGLYIRNVSNPYVTTHVGSVNTPGTCFDVLVEGNLVYAADGSSGIQIIDVSNPSSPTIIGSYDTAGNVYRLALQGNTLFVADGSNGLVILDVADPTHPVFVDRISLPTTWDVVLYGGDVVIATNGGVYTYRVGYNLAALPLIGTFTGYEVWDVRVQGDVAYVAAGPDGFITLDVSNPSAPVLLDQFDPGAVNVIKLDVQGHFACCFDYSMGGTFFVFDVSDPSNIIVTDTLSAGSCIDVFMYGEVIFYSFWGGFGAANFSDPYNIGIIFNWDTFTANMTALWAQGNHLYIVSNVSSGTGFFIYDITDISSPNSVYNWTLVSTNQYDIFVEGDSAYIVDTAGTGYSEVWNVTDPFNAYYSDYVNAVSGAPKGVWGFGPYMLTANYTGGVALWDTSDINDMQYLSGYAGANRAIQITVAGDYAYVANRTSLVILRLFRSAGATYTPGPCQAASLEIDSTNRLIENATLTYTGYVPPGTSINFEMSANGGTNWEAVTPGVEHSFTNPGNDLRWRVIPNTDVDDRSVHLYSVNIDYEYNDLPTAPVLTDPGTSDDDGIFPVSWSASTDDSSIDHYVLQMSDSASFTTILNTWNPTTTSVDVTVTASGIYHFRVRAIDDDGEAGPWSNDESIDANVPILPPPIPGFPIEAIALGAILAVGLGLVSRRRKRRNT